MDFDTALHYYTIKEDFFLPFFLFVFLFWVVYLFFKSGQCYRQGHNFGTNLCSGICLRRVFGPNTGWWHHPLSGQLTNPKIYTTLPSLIFEDYNPVKISVSLCPVPASVGKLELCCEPGSGQATQWLWQKPSESWYHCHPVLSPPPLLHPLSEGSWISCPSPKDTRGKGTLAQ